MASGVIKYKIGLADKATTATNATNATKATTATTASSSTSTTYITTLQLTTTVLAAKTSCFFTSSSAAITSGSLTVPGWSKGIMVTNNANDAAMFGYANGKLFIAFRNNGVWGARRDI